MKKAKKKNKAIKKKIPLAKSLGEFMKDEEGFVSKENILKVGLSTVAALGAAGALTDLASGQTTHRNSIVTGPDDACVTHTNVTTHSSY
jgi:hypothetical protein